ncbi:hypothetical protein [Mycobacterium sp. DBP42]|uniref:hypothetical protein n=1 Tax=Mycobacterium sp. DBP42 TaxID=2545267 RepID=UPI00110CC483|nr:hypothetical protein [Mycobacterium sp. DBP42]TMS53368.1 hypothetical protein E0T84_12285 [Mycobacterium sp. DBP42]
MTSAVTERFNPPGQQQTDCRTAELLRQGLRWLYDTAQPAEAVIDGRVASTRLASVNRVIRLVPLGWAWKPGIVVEVAHVHWGLGTNGPLNPLSSSEVTLLADELEQLGADIADIRCPTTSLSGTIALLRPAHPTLRAAVARFAAGCPVHHSRICGRGENRGGHNCRWATDGQRGVIWPFADPIRAEAHRP